MKLSIETRLKILYNLKIAAGAAFALFLSIAAFEYLAVGTGINWPVLGYALVAALMYYCAHRREISYKQ